MNLLPKALGTRPRLAVEIKPEGVVAARAEDAAAILAAVAQAPYALGALTPGLRPGNVANRVAVVASVRKALEAVTLRERATSVIIPDTAVRVLLLDFDALPAKPAEAMPVVRFRLKKLLPFDADGAAISYQVMSSSKSLVRVLAVAVPREVLEEYESIVREAGFEPGAVLPSTLASLAGLDESAAPALIVNVGENAVTTAIVQGGVLLLHRTVDLAADGAPELVPEPLYPALPLVNAEHTAGEWAMQAPATGYGVLDDGHIAEADEQARRLAQQIALEISQDISQELAAELHAMPQPTEDRMTAAAREVTQAVSVAVAYFEDTLQSQPTQMLAAGTMGAALLEDLLGESGWAGSGSAGSLHVHELVESAHFATGAQASRTPPGWLAGVRGALKN